MFAALFVTRHGFELVLDLLQQKHLRSRKDRVPAHLKGKVDLETIRKAVLYNLERLRFGMVSGLYGTVFLWGMILIGFQLSDDIAVSFEQGPILTGLLFFAVVGAVSWVWTLPVELYSVFKIEEKYGFNRQTLAGFVSDKLKEIVISVILGGGIVAVVLALMEHGGRFWWLYAYAGVMAIQLLVTWIYPLLIMPLFNRLTPITGELAHEVEALAARVDFSMKGVVSMDGSRRSSHANAFFIGFFGAKRVVLYDTLVEKLTLPALLAVLAHEFGHFKLRHLLRRLIFMTAAMLGLFAVLAVFREQPELYTGLGFSRVSSHGGLVVFAIFIGEVLAPSGWLFRYLSRRDEYASDRFAVDAVGRGQDLEDALVALTKQNLGSPGSHPLYRSYHNSHPALKERLRAIKSHAKSRGFSA